MNYPVDTPIQLRAILRAVRKAQKLSQAEIGERLGVNQKRVARIESSPGLTSFDQIARMVNALGGRLFIETTEASLQPEGPSKSLSRRSSATEGSW
jgi:HTH-type transcriptional regulator/antitoxin HipB